MAVQVENAQVDGGFGVPHIHRFQIQAFRPGMINGHSFSSSVVISSQLKKLFRFIRTCRALFGHKSCLPRRHHSHNFLLREDVEKYVKDYIHYT
jgi:hypothetical protein